MADVVKTTATSELSGLHNKINLGYAGGYNKPTITDKIRKDIFVKLYMSARRKLLNMRHLTKSRVSTSDGGNLRRRGSLNKYKYLLLGIAAIIVLFVIVSSFNGNDTSGREVLKSETEFKGIIAEQTVDREFNFPLVGEDGEELSSVKFEIEKAQLRDTVLVQGQQAYAPEGKIFLVIHLKITNQLDQAIEMNTKDFVRLVAEGNEEEMLAPEMHNDPVQVLAISTKPTRVGFSVNKEDEEFVLKVGEINGEKQDVEINLGK